MWRSTSAPNREAATFRSNCVVSIGASLPIKPGTAELQIKRRKEERERREKGGERSEKRLRSGGYQKRRVWVARGGEAQEGDKGQRRRGRHTL